MVALCRHGPPSSRVDSVTSETAGVDELNLRRAGEAFSVLPRCRRILLIVDVGSLYPILQREVKNHRGSLAIASLSSWIS